MEADPTTLFVWRAIERVAGLLIAGLLVYLGYRLFINLPDKTDSEGKVVLPGNVSVFLSRIGPGAFFALFGAVIVAFSIITQMQYQPDIGRSDSDSSGGAWKYFADSQGTADIVKPDIYQAQLIADIGTLNNLDRALDEYVRKRSAVGGKLATAVQLSIPRIKQSIILSVWKKEWGDKKAFIDWVDHNAPLPPPQGLEKVSEIFTKTGK